ncbi:putative bifunctional diguanylate cyclase/phosphodiesterase [Ureibacillus chungkukjangi]|uniref:Diguanylate cyclase/phosphodiesterase with PAS/PAC sensor(S) n=1 Tax=Ureibacillus chungkukjangi TaxID=1202712 RepID=A0A318TQE4_9BACL|nr:GGDEF domain-containing phosphodiesterase [Ureibacillus chungkukjangi]PYF06894.1 diguanylate cyclase/phosphodiesterase with PAS/PAC sensor(s) [Ureibacillus chungkukjangi]
MRELLNNLKLNMNNGNLLHTTSLLLRVFENIQEGIMVTDSQMRILFVNNAFESVTGYKKEEVVGKGPQVLQSGIHNHDFYKEMWAILSKEGNWQGEIWNKRKSGEIYPEWLSIMVMKDENDNVTNYCGIFTDLSERKRVEEQLEKRALTDSLTDVNNRFSYLEKMNLLLNEDSRHEEEQHAIFFLDLDRFKQVNDTLGHEIGDYLLVDVANRLKRLLGAKDIVARYGGDEFVLTLTELRHPREAAKFAEQIIKEIEKPVKINNQEIFVSTSIGISIYPHDGDTTEELLNRADKAMYYAKQSGRNRFSFYFDELNTDANRLILLDSELRKAIDNHDFELYFQPKVNVRENKIIGFEALVRWNSEKLGFVSPAEFIPYAEETGLIIPISEVIIEKACEELSILRKAGYSKLPISINISSIHFQQTNFLESIQIILERNNTSAHNFEIEVTERTVMNNDADTISKLVRLKQLGFKISIDDFGTGYSSLSYLVRFPVDYLKIDKSFIQHIVNLADKQAIVDAIIQMAHRLNMQVIAEGVESIQQLNQLSRMGCDFIQGYYYSKPVPIEELIEFLQFWEYEHQGEIES